MTDKVRCELSSAEHEQHKRLRRQRSRAKRLVETCADMAGKYQQPDGDIDQLALTGTRMVARWQQKLEQFEAKMDEQYG